MHIIPTPGLILCDVSQVMKHSLCPLDYLDNQKRKKIFDVLFDISYRKTPAYASLYHRKRKLNGL